MSHKVEWKCDACGQACETGYRVATQRIAPGWSYLDDGWVYPGTSPLNPARQRADICDACIDRGVRVHPSHGIDWEHARSKEEAAA